MITSTQVPSFDTLGFDGPKYIRMQMQAIEDRLAQFSGRMYLEIGGKFLYDPHAARVLPGFDPASKKDIFASFAEVAEVLFCVNAHDIANNRQLTSTGEDYVSTVLTMINDIQTQTSMKPHVVINNMDPYASPASVMDFEKSLQKQGYKVWERYLIDGYPDDVDTVLSEDGFGQDDHIPLTKELILVTGAASNSGKLSTCLGQIYQDELIGIESGYAKYETFPVWNFSIDHPVNLAYEAATADIGDYNMLDHYHQEAYSIESVNYNRDVEAFELLQKLADEFVSPSNAIRSYKSPTDMGINTVGSAIMDDSLVCLACLEEIERRKYWYIDMGLQDAAKKCEELLAKAKEYCQSKSYMK